MKKTMAFLLTMLLFGALFALPTAAITEKTIQWAGTTLTLEETDCKEDKEITLSAALHIDPASFDAFDSCTLMLSYDNAIIDLADNPASSIYVEGIEYIVISEKTVYGYKASIMNDENAVPAADGFVCNLNLEMKILDAEALIDAGEVKVELALFESDMKVVKDEEIFSYKDSGAENGIEMKVQLSPAIIKVNSNREVYTIKYETNGGTTVEPDEVKEKKPTALPKTTREGYTFIGWFSDTALTNKVADPYTATANITLYAKWAKNDKVYTVTFNSNGGAAIAAGKFTGETAEALPKPTKEGYTFAGWYTDVALKNKAVDPYLATKDITLYAKWTKNEEDKKASYKITYETNGGTKIAATEIEAGKAITLPTPVKSGYAFAGWYTDSLLKTKINGTTYMPTADVTFYAKWTVSSNSVPKTGRDNGTTVLFGILGALVLCTGAVVFLQHRKIKRNR